MGDVKKFRENMKRRLTHPAVFMLVLCICIICAPSIMAGAEDAAEIETDTAAEIREVNPVYEGIVNESDLNEASAASEYDPEYMTDEDTIIASLRSALENRQATMSFCCDLEGEINEDVLTSWMDRAMEETGKWTQGDYLRWSVGGFTAEVYDVEKDDMPYYTVTMAFTYYTTAEQEDRVTQKVQELINSFDFTADDSDYFKIKTIYDYVCDYVEYDCTHVNDENYQLKLTAYAALFDGRAICQGYALLLYRMLHEAGIDSRIITGCSQDQSHAWNIVSLNGAYYNLDSTWDAGKESYSCFLKGEVCFSDHLRDERYMSDSFKQKYPVPGTDYAVQDGDFPQQTSCTKNKITYTILGKRATVTGYTGKPVNVTIPEKISGATVTSIGGKAFSGCTSLVSVSLPATIHKIQDGYFDYENPYGAFYKCTSLKTVQIPSDSQLSYIGEWAFFGCKKLSNPVLPSSIRTLALSSFEGCKSITKLVLPEGLETVCQNALNNTGMTTIHIPASCTFFHLINFDFQSITVEKGNPVYRAEDGVLYEWGNWFMDLDSGDRIYKDMWALSIYPSDKKDTFYQVPDFAGIILRPIDLNENRYLEKIDIGSCYIEEVFLIKQIIAVDKDNPYYSSKEQILYNKNGQEIVQIPKTINGVLTIPDGVTKIRQDAGREGMYTSVILSDSVKEMEAGAFWRCHGLDTFELSSRITTLAESLFDQSNLKKISIPGNIRKIKDRAFAMNASLKIYFWGDAPRIDNEAFYASDNVQAYYPADNPTWTKSKLKNYGGTVIWHKWIPDKKNEWTPGELDVPYISDISNQNGGIKIQWNAIDGAVKYRVLRRNGTGRWEKAGDTCSLDYTDTSVENGKTYTYTVRCISTDAKKYTSTYDNVGKTIKYLSAPKGSVSNVSSGVMIKWKKIAGVSGYYIYRKTGKEKYDRIGNVTGNNAFSYIDKTARSGKIYTYAVRAYCGSVKSGYKGKSIHYLAQPSVSGAANTKSGITVKWKPVPGASGYYIYRKKGSGKWSKIKTIANSSILSYTDTAVAEQNGSTYLYTVKAFSGSSVSSYMSGKKMIRLTASSISGLSNSADRSILVKWDKNNSSDGYQIKYTTGSDSDVVLVQGTSVTQKKIKGLVKNKTYKVYVRSYKKISGKNYYSAWCSAKTVKIYH